MRARGWWTVGGVALVFAAAAAVLSGLVPGVALGLGKDRPGASKPEPTLAFAPHEVVQPLRMPMPERLSFSGPLVAPGTAVVRARATGSLLALTVSEGSRVVAGQVLGRLDVSDLGARESERAAGLEAARTALAQAERTHANNERLAAQQFISIAALDGSRAAVETAQAQVAQARASLQSVQVTLRDAGLVAPIPGIVAKRHVLPGEKVSAEQPLLTIVDLSRLELAGSAGTHQVSRLQPGLAVQVQVEGTAEPVAGRIARIAPAAEPGTRSIGVVIDVPNPQERFRAGQYAVAAVVLDDPTPRLTVPVTALSATGGQEHVWLIQDGLLVRRAVVTGRRDEREARVEVLQGLEPGARVIALRFDNLREGAKAVVGAPGADKAAAVASAAASTPAVR